MIKKQTNLSVWFSVGLFFSAGKFLGRSAEAAVPGSIPKISKRLWTVSRTRWQKSEPFATQLRSPRFESGSSDKSDHFLKNNSWASPTESPSSPRRSRGPKLLSKSFEGLCRWFLTGTGHRHWKTKDTRDSFLEKCRSSHPFFKRN